jgi:hypothetical protein
MIIAMPELSIKVSPKAPETVSRGDTGRAAPDLFHPLPLRRDDPTLSERRSVSRPFLYVLIIFMENLPFGLRLGYASIHYQIEMALRLPVAPL